MEIDHIGYAVKRIDRAIASFEKLGFSFESVIEDYDRNVKLVFGDNDGYRIELVSPLDKGKESPVDQYLSNTSGTPYHICYQSNAFDTDIDNLKKTGFKEIIAPAKAIAFNGRRVVFLTNLGVGLLEIVEVI